MRSRHQRALLGIDVRPADSMLYGAGGRRHASSPSRMDGKATMKSKLETMLKPRAWLGDGRFQSGRGPAARDGQ